MLGGGSDGAKKPLFAGKSSRLALSDSTGSAMGASATTRKRPADYTGREQGGRERGEHDHRIRHGRGDVCRLRPARESRRPVSRSLDGRGRDVVRSARDGGRGRVRLCDARRWLRGRVGLCARLGPRGRRGRGRSGGRGLACGGGRLGPPAARERKRAGNVPISFRVREDVGRQRLDRRPVARKRVDVAHAATRVPVPDHALRTAVQGSGGRHRSGGHDPGECGENGNAANHGHQWTCPLSTESKRCVLAAALVRPARAICSSSSRGRLLRLTRPEARRDTRAAARRARRRPRGRPRRAGSGTRPVRHGKRAAGARARASRQVTPTARPRR